MNHTEIERKWLIDGFPALPEQQRFEMEQGYLNFDTPTVRIRSSQSNNNENYWLTIKGSGRLVRTEVELELSASQYQALQQLLVGPPAHKQLRTYRLPDGSLLECNLVDQGQPTSFYYAEVEFSSPEQANAFIPPSFLGKELTNLPGSSMAEYCRQKAKQPE